MKKVLLVLGGVFVVLIILAGIGVGYFAYLGNKLDNSSKLFVESAVPKVVDGWNRYEFRKHSSEVFFQATGERGFRALFDKLNKLGDLVEFGDVKGQAHIQLGTDQYPYQALYVVDATFATGPASMQIVLVQEDGEWGIAGFRVKSDYLLDDTQKAKLKPDSPTFRDLVNLSSEDTAEDIDRDLTANPAYETLVHNADVLVIPTFGIDYEFLRTLVHELSVMHKKAFAITTHFRLRGYQYNSKRNQFMADQIFEDSDEMRKRLLNIAGNKPILIILEGDMNDPRSSSAYWFSRHFPDERVSIISLARIDPENWGYKPDPELKLTRAKKLANKSLGYHLYDLEPTTNEKSVMLTPIRGLDDLDRSGVWYAGASSKGITGTAGASPK